MKRVVNKLAIYGVKVKVFRQDSLVTGRTDDIETAADELQVEQQIRAPYQHEGQDENFIRTLVCCMATMFSASPWMPRQLWLYAAQLRILLYNLMLEPSGSRMTRLEAMTGRRPDWKKMPIAQFGAPFLIYKDKKSQREWAFDEHGCFAAYLGPVPKTIDQHYFYRFETKRICIRDSYHILQNRPSEWDMYTKSNDKTFKILYEEKDLLEDMYLPFDGSKY